MADVGPDRQLDGGRIEHFRRGRAPDAAGDFWHACSATAWRWSVVVECDGEQRPVPRAEIQAIRLAGDS